MPQGKLQMTTTRFPYNGRDVIVGVLRENTSGERVSPLIAPALVQKVNAECGTNLKLPSPPLLDHLLNRTDGWKEMKEAFPAPTNMAIAYEKVGKELGKKVVYNNGEGRWVVLSTGKHEGKQGVALVVPGLTADDIRKDGKDIVIDVPKRLVVVPKFPSEPLGIDFFKPHPETTVPHGEKVEASPEARRLFRLTNSSYVGLLVRDCNSTFRDIGQNVHANYNPFKKLGVLVEVPQGDLDKIESVSSIAPEEKKTVIEIDIPIGELLELLSRFGKELEEVGKTAGAESLPNARKVEAILRKVTLALKR